MSQDHFLVAVFPDQDGAHRAVEAMLEAGCSTNRISVLGKLKAEGDDVLGMLHPDLSEQMKVWATNGALWGALLGMLTGAAGLFLFPGLGAALIVGPLAEAVVGGATGAVLGGGALAGAAAWSHWAHALHRHGLPAHALEELHRQVEAGRYLVILQGANVAELENQRPALVRGRPDRVEVLP